MPSLLVPLFAYLALSQMTREYMSEAEIFIDESYFKHPDILAFGLKLGIEDRLPSLKKMMKGDENLFYILGEEKPEKMSATYLLELGKKKAAMLAELKGPGISKMIYSGTDRQQVKEVVDRMVEKFIEAVFQPFQGIGARLRDRALKRDDLLNSKLMPEYTRAKAAFESVSKTFTAASPDYQTAKHEYEIWESKVEARRQVVLAKATAVLPLKDDDPDISKITAIIVPASVAVAPFKPQKVKILAIAIIGGIALGFFFTFIMEFLDHSLREVSDVDQHIGLPVIGRIPRIKAVEQGGKQNGSQDHSQNLETRPKTTLRRWSWLGALSSKKW